MSRLEHLFNALAGLSVLSWAVLGMVAVDPDQRTSAVRICIVALNTCVGLLFLVRKPVVEHGSYRAVLVSLPSLVVCGLAFKLSPAPQDWPLYAEIVFAIGTVLAIIALGYLGRCFAVFPASRGTVATGPYRLVRHPVYVAESLLVLACFMADPQWLAALPLLALVPSIIIRIKMEEDLLSRTANYRRYAERVTWRLLPGVW